MKKTIYDITQRRDVVRTYENGICPTLNQMMGTGGNNVPIIETVFRDHSFGPKVEDSVAGTIRAQGGAKNGSENLVLSSANTNAAITRNKAPAIMAYQPAIVVGALSAHEGRSMQDSQAVDAGHVLEHPKPVWALGCGTSVSNQLVDQSHVIPTRLQGVRRLTPRECERLQGLPSICEFILLDFENFRLRTFSCFEYQRDHALNSVEKCLRSQKPVGSVEKINLWDFAKSVEKNTPIRHLRNNKLALLNVHTNLEELEAEILKANKSKNTVLFADEDFSFPLPKVTESLAQLIVGTSSILEKETQIGKEDSQKSDTRLIEVGNGEIALNKYGKEMMLPVKDAEDIKANAIRLLRRIMSSPSQISQLEQMLIISFCSVWSVINGYIHQETCPMILLEVHRGYTQIDHKSCSDSARYKALGNGMAQPCADYVMSVVVKMLSDEEEE